MKIRRLAVTLAAVCLLASSAAADEAPLFRVFLRDGTNLVSYGEFARVGDRIVFTMPVSAGADAPLHVVNLSADRVDWDRTNRYAESTRAARYLSTRAESDYIALSNDVARALDVVSQIDDPKKRLAVVENARTTLAGWPKDHYSYRGNEVRQMLGMLDDAIADLRTANGERGLKLTLTTYSAPPPPVIEAPLPAPTPKDAIEQTLMAARLADSSADRESLLDAAIFEIDRRGTDLPADWASATRVAAQAELVSERRIDAEYQTMSSQVMAAVDRRVRSADVRGIERAMAAIDRGDAVLGHRRPDIVNALVTAVQSRLDEARQLRLARDHWALRQVDFNRYRLALSEPIDVFALCARVSPALEDIKALAGSTPAILNATDRVIAQLAKRAALIVPPPEFSSAHALLISGAQLAANAAAIRREAALSGNMSRAWEASSAAAGALMLLSRARTEIETLFRPPELR